MSYTITYRHYKRMFDVCIICCFFTLVFNMLFLEWCPYTGGPNKIMMGCFPCSPVILMFYGTLHIWHNRSAVVRLSSQCVPADCVCTL